MQQIPSTRQLPPLSRRRSQLEEGEHSGSQRARAQESIHPRRRRPSNQDLPLPPQCQLRLQSPPSTVTLPPPSLSHDLKLPSHLPLFSLEIQQPSHLPSSVRVVGHPTLLPNDTVGLSLPLPTLPRHLPSLHLSQHLPTPPGVPFPRKIRPLQLHPTTSRLRQPFNLEDSRLRR